MPANHVQPPTYSKRSNKHGLGFQLALTLPASCETASAVLRNYRWCQGVDPAASEAGVGPSLWFTPPFSFGRYKQPPVFTGWFLSFGEPGLLKPLSRGPSFAASGPGMQGTLTSRWQIVELALGLAWRNKKAHQNTG